MKYTTSLPEKMVSYLPHKDRSKLNSGAFRLVVVCGMSAWMHYEVQEEIIGGAEARAIEILSKLKQLNSPPMQYIGTELSIDDVEYVEEYHANDGEKIKRYLGEMEKKMEKSKP